MEHSDQDAVKPPSETPKDASGKINPAFRDEQFEDGLIRTGLNRAEIARLMGVSPSTVYRWGRHTPAPKMLIAFLRLYQAWAVEEELLNNAIEQLDGGGTRNQVARNLRKAIELRNDTEKFLSEMP